MTKTFKHIIIAAIALIAIAGAACAFVVASGSSANATNPLENVGASAVNAVLDASDLKGRVASKMRQKAGEVADELGVPRAMADNIVDSLAIEDWRATALPADAVETGSYTMSTDDMTARMTTYDDPGIVTVEAYGLSVTMAVPESAQTYLPLVKYLDSARE